MSDDLHTPADLIHQLAGLVYRCAFTSDRRFLWASQGCLLLTGYERSGLPEANHLIHPDDQQSVWEHLQESVAQNLPYRFAYRILTREGTERWVLDQGQGRRDPEGTVSVLEGMLTEISPPHASGSGFPALKEPTGQQRAPIEEQRAESMLRLLLSTTQAISEADDFQSALDVTLRKVCETTGWDFGEAWIPDSPQTQLVCSPAFYSSSPRLLGFRHISQSLTYSKGIGLPGRVWQHQQPEWVSDASTQLDAFFLRTRLAQKIGLKASFGIPIAVGGEVLAVLVFFLFEAQEEDQPLMELVSTVAGQLGSLMRRKQAQEELARSEAKYRTLVERMNEGILVDDPQGVIQLVNDQFCQMVGYSREELLGFTLQERLLVTEADRIRFETKSRSRAQGISDHYELQLQKKNGQLMWVLVSGTPITDSRGQYIGSMGINTDITERKQFEAALLASERRFRALFEQSPAAIILSDLTGRILECNPLTESLYQYSRQELLQQFTWSCCHSQDLDLDCHLYQELLSGERDRYQVEKRHLKKGGRPFWANVTVGLVRDERGMPQYVLSSVSDVTELRQSEQEVRLLQTLTQAIGECPDFHSALVVTLKRVSQATGWDFAEAWIPNASGDQLIYCPGWFSSRPELEGFGQRSSLLTFGLGQGLPGRIWELQRPIWTRDVTQLEPGQFARRDLALNHGIKACFGVPILSGPRTAGTSPLEQGQSQELLAVLMFHLTEARDEDHRLVALVSTVSAQVGSLMKRKHAEDALRLAEENYRSIFENAVEGIFQTTPEGHYLSVNPALATIYGYSSAAELISCLTDISRQLYVDPARRGQFIRELQQNGSVSRFESEVYRRDGSIIWISEHARAVYDPQGHIIRYEGLVEDITVLKQIEEEHRQTQRELQHSLLLLQATLDSTADGIIATTLNGKILSCNQRFLELWALSSGANQRPKALHLNLLAKQTKDPVYFLDRIQELVDEQEAYDLIELNDGRIFERFSKPLFLEDQTLGRVWSYRDITEVKKVERLKNEFVSMVSHELRTPLTSIRGSLGLMMGGVSGELPPQARTLIHIAQKNSDRLVLLINDILDIEKIESGKMNFEMQPLPLMPLLEQAIETNQAFGQQFGVSFALEPSTPIWGQVFVDPNRLLQVLTNLLSNAAKFSLPNSVVRVGVTQGDKSVKVEVKDHGPGVPDSFRSHIFQKFAQADSSTTRQKSGTGLGLSICKAIIEKFGGSIGFSSIPHVETTFYFMLPLYQDPLAFPPPQGSDPIRILVCEDDPDTANLLRLLLLQGGYQVDLAKNGAEAKHLLGYPDTEAPCPYAAMTLDLGLPDQGGVNLLNELRGSPKTQQLPIVVVSAQTAPNDSEPGSWPGVGIRVIDWLSKPIDQVRLLDAVQRASKSHARPRILHVEDDPDIVKVVSVILQDVADVVSSASLTVALQYLSQEAFDLVLLDWSLPDGSGAEFLDQLNQSTLPQVPVVVFSATDMGSNAGATVAATLIKSQTSNEKLLETIRQLVLPISPLGSCPP